MGLMGTLSIWVANASDTGCWEWLWTIPMATYATWIVYGCDRDIPIITVYWDNWNWKSFWITIKAMNEWTWEVKIWSLNDTGAYWSLYQWWNNYPFPNVADLTSMIITGTTMVDASWYGPWTTTGYYNRNIRYKGPSWDSSYNANKWWGSWDNKINRWFDTGNFSVINSTDRQAMCPEWYHIPSAWEWGALLYLWWKNYDTNQWTQLFTDWSLNKLNSKSSLGWTWMRFSEDMQIPFVGQRNYDFKASPNSSAGYWSSSPYSDRANYIRAYFFGNDSMFWWDYSDGFGYAVRCFKNYIAVPQTFTITFLNGNEHVWSGDIVSWDKIPEEVISWYNLTWLTKEWYTFSGWIISGSDEKIDVENDIITTWMILNAVWQINQYTITFKDWDNEITSITADYWTWITPPPNPTKNGHIFKWWDKPVPSTMPAEDMIISAKWERNWSSGGWWGWGWWGSSSKTDTGSASSQTWNQINSNTWDTASTWTNIKEPETNTGSNIQTWSQQPLSPMDSSLDREQTVTPLIGGDGEARGGWTQTYTQEFQQAYKFAHEKWITTMPTIQEAQMNGKLTRIAMAKMLSQYAMNVLWQKPANIITPKFNDVSDKQNSDYDDWVTLAYQLWIMWQNMPNNKFRPNDEVTRAEFATALSRMAYWTSDGEYKWTWKYYIHHMEKLVKEWIITNDDPNMKELRWYVMIMLMRSTK